MWSYNPVSILVLVDVALRLGSFLSIPPNIGVSILVLVDVALRLGSFLSIPPNIGVSILVLVDVALRLPWKMDGEQLERLFQSLF